jgi:hypothetical protein
MKSKLRTFTLFIVGANLIVGLARPPQASAQGWRCDDPPGEAECQEALINDIEDIVDSDWDTGVIPMPPIPYTCTRAPGPRPIVEDEEASEASFSSQLNWSLTLNMDLLSFLIGRDSAHADLRGSIRARSSSQLDKTWTNQTINFAFDEGTDEVMAPEGSTGVYDLGSFRPTVVGAFWNGTLPIDLSLSDGDWTCVFGPPGSWITVHGRNGVHVDYPVPRTTVQNLIAEEVVREQFRRAVILAVTGEF